MAGKRMRRLIAAVMSAAMVLSGGSITALVAINGGILLEV